jgi:hypothetical protein
MLWLRILKVQFARREVGLMKVWEKRVKTSMRMYVLRAKNKDFFIILDSSYGTC